MKVSRSDVPEIKGMRNDRRRSDTVHTHLIENRMTNKEVSRTSEVQYGAANKLEKGWIRLFNIGFDVKADEFGKWNREGFADYVELQREHYDDLNEPIITDEGVLITAGEKRERVCFIDKDVFSDFPSIINANKSKKIWK